MAKRLGTGFAACCLIGSLLASCGDDDQPSPHDGEAGTRPVEAGAGQGGAGGAPSSTDAAGRGGQGSLPQGGAGAEPAAGQGGVSTTNGGRPDAAGQPGGGGDTSSSGAAGGSDAGSGAGGEAGSGGAPDDLPVGSAKLGARCDSTAQCSDPRAPDLFCLAPDDASLGAAPPSGLCTADCETHEDCEAIAPGALCEDVLWNGSRYCIEGCVPGDPAEGTSKCHDRHELACTPLYLADTQDPCTLPSECFFGETCMAGTCQVIFAGCLPACQGDNDCACQGDECEQELYCDKTYQVGNCVPEVQTGKKLGEPCTVTNQEPDECLGFCLQDSPGGSTGHCSEGCSYGYPCAFDEASQRYEGSCAYRIGLVTDPGRGDFGYCASACACTEQCIDPALVCVDASLDTNAFSGSGLCYTSGTPLLDECGAGGAGSGG
jgi:hypothetical protein